jgi:glycosyltransferase involved in cell wall biosynthesis
VVDDASTDGTAAVVRGVADPRVHLHVKATNTGYADTFEEALLRSSGAVILLADQDDVWPADRVRSMCAALAHASVVAGGVELLDGGTLRGPFGQRTWRLPRDPRRRWRVLAGLAVSNVPYFGSAMGLRREALDRVLPFPPSARELPDAWLALVGLATRSISHLARPVVLRRVHGANTTGRMRSIPLVLRGRWYFLRMVLEAHRRVNF